MMPIDFGLISDIINQINAEYYVNIVTLSEIEFNIENIVGVVLGIAVYSMTIILSVVTAFDVGYITMPILRDLIDQYRFDGTKKNILRFVSRDAVSSVEEATVSIDGRSALSIYLYKRIKTYIISAVLIIVFVGEFDAIRNLISLVVKAIVLGSS
jgi:hypothetical protein